MRRVAIIGGETHLGEILALVGTELEVTGTSMPEPLRALAFPGLQVPNLDSPERLLAEIEHDLVALANENDHRFAAVMAALRAGKDVVADKPLCLAMEEQVELERYLADHPERRLLTLLTLRGTPLWAGLREQIREGAIGIPAFTHVRMAVRLKREQRPPWFLDVRRSGGMFLDLLIHGLDQVEWLSGRRIVAVTANTGNVGDPTDPYLRDHAAVYCELDDGTAAMVEGQRLLPDTQNEDYRATVAGSLGVADLRMSPPRLTVTSPAGADAEVQDLPAPVSVVADWLEQGSVVDQAASLRANRLALLATLSAQERRRVEGA
jgi:predicted dehydrogenase